MNAVELPDQARGRLQALEQSAQVHSAAAHSLSDAIGAQRSALAHAMAAGDQQRAVAKIESELAGLNQKHAEHRRRQQNATATATRCKSFLAQMQLNGGGKLATVALRPTLSKVEKLLDAIARLRDEIASLKNEITTMRKAPLAEVALRQAAAALCAKLATDAGVAITGAEALSISCKGDTLALLAWAMPTAMVEAIIRDLPKGNLTVDAKRQRIAELETALLRAERVEELLVERAQAAGEDIERRADASPLALLGVEVAVEEVAA